MNNILQQDKYADFNDFYKQVISEVDSYTMVSPERLFDVINATEYIIKNKIKGDFVECGVWRGGCIMAVIKTLVNMKCIDRDIWLYDTFNGMSKPTEQDKSFLGESAKKGMMKA